MSLAHLFRRAAALVALATMASAFGTSFASADTFQQVTEESEFVGLVSGRTLRYPGVKLTVSPQGEIEGRGLGIPVTGEWRWQGNYFCRDLFWGGQDLGANCQAVLRNGSVLRFVSDQGTGQSADFRLR